METKRNENEKEKIQERLLSKIKQLVADEKFKLDAFYLCGAASGLPNQNLQKACERYLEMAECGQSDEKVISDLIRELEKAVTAKAKVTVVGDLVNNQKDIEEVFAQRDFL